MPERAHIVASLRLAPKDLGRLDHAGDETGAVLGTCIKKFSFGGSVAALLGRLPQVSPAGRVSN